MIINTQTAHTLALTAAIAWGALEVLKPALKLAKIEPRSPRHTLAVRLSALIIGAAVGTPLHLALEGAGGGTAGAAIGAAAGALNAAIVAALKRKMKGRR